MKYLILLLTGLTVSCSLPDMSAYNFPSAYNYVPSVSSDTDFGPRTLIEQTAYEAPSGSAPYYQTRVIRNPYIR